MARLRRNGSRIHVEAHGSGKEILLTHGFGATSRMWDEQIEEFTDRYRMILWDLPGHGQSQQLEGKAALVEQMADILDSEHAERAVFIGLGVGGALSLRFWRAFPERVRGLVLIGTMPGLRTGAAREIWNGQVDTMVHSLEAGGLDALEGGAEVDPRLHLCPDGLISAALDMLTQTDDGALPFLAEIDVPVLVLAGGEDRPGLSAAQFMARAIPAATKVIIPRANHAANIHKPEAVNRAIGEFLRGLPA